MKAEKSWLTKIAGACLVDVVGEVGAVGDEKLVKW